MIPIGWECAAEAGRELASYTGVSLAVQVEIQVTDLHWLALDHGNTNFWRACFLLSVSQDLGGAVCGSVTPRHCWFGLVRSLSRWESNGNRSPSLAYPHNP